MDKVSGGERIHGGGAAASGGGSAWRYDGAARVTSILPSHAASTTRHAVAAYILWLLGSFCLLAAYWTEGHVVTEVHQICKFLPGCSQRHRSLANMISNSAMQLASVFLVAGAVAWSAWLHRLVRRERAEAGCGVRVVVAALWLTHPASLPRAQATLFTLVAAVVFVAPCITDIQSAILTSRLQYTDSPTILAAQGALGGRRHGSCLQLEPRGATVMIVAPFPLPPAPAIPAVAMDMYHEPSCGIDAPAGLPVVMEAVLAPYHRHAGIIRDHGEPLSRVVPGLVHED
jgi:hypothetical protein